MLKVGKRFVNKLNKYIPCKGFEDVSALRKLLNEMTAHEEGEFPHNQIYWDKEVYLDCDGNDDKCNELLLFTDKCRFYVSGDPKEHPGVVIRYKQNEDK